MYSGRDRASRLADLALAGLVAGLGGAGNLGGPHGFQPVLVRLGLGALALKLFETGEGRIRTSDVLVRGVFHVRDLGHG
jgi:hypothetical protein